MGLNTLKYVLITPARNEERNIGRLIKSVIAQTILPKKWIIVSDASTDNTDDIVKRYLNDNSWMQLMRMPEKRDRNFAAKVFSFNAGYEVVKNLDYDIIGCLDADTSFESDYFEFLIGKFLEFPDLGVAGTPFVEDDGYSSITDSFEGEKHVAGGCQLFRKECFLDIGGYVPYKAGGIDWIAVTTARMKGWRTQSFREKVFYHHRRLGTGESSSIYAIFKYGKEDYYIGNHPVWELFRVLYRLKERPYIVNSFVLLSGYIWAMITIKKRPISQELVRFHRQEEMQKLKSILKTALRLKKIDSFKVDSYTA